MRNFFPITNLYRYVLAHVPVQDKRRWAIAARVYKEYNDHYIFVNFKVDDPSLTFLKKWAAEVDKKDEKEES